MKKKKDKNKVEAVKKHPFAFLSALVDLYAEYRESYDYKKLSELRENISLTLFYLADTASSNIADYDKKDYERKRAYAESELKLKENKERGTTVKDIENQARVECKSFDDACADALKEKENTRMIIAAANQILNAIATRLHILEKKTNE